MHDFNLDLSFEVCEGSIHGLGHLRLWIRLRADTRNPTHPPPECLVCERHGQHWSPPDMREITLNHQQLIELVTHLNLLLQRSPGGYAAITSSIAGWQQVSLDYCLNGQQHQSTVTLQYAGVQGPDAGLLRQVWSILARLTGAHRSETWIEGTS